jgi:hypothetical protein
MTDLQEKRTWERLGFANALAAADIEAALTPEEAAALPTLRLWQRIGLRHVTLADAVNHNRALHAQKEPIA